MPIFSKVLRAFKVKFNYKILVFGLFVFALIIRFWGVWHGLPYIYSVDEPALVHTVLGLRFDLNPHHFDWPHFHFYLSYLVFGIFYKARVAWQVWDWKPAMEAVAPILWNDGAIFYLLLRLLSVLMGALTVIPVFLAAKELFKNYKKALLAAFIFAVIPFHVENSKFALIDVPATFWAAWSFYFALKVFNKPRLWIYLVAGFLGGLAASTKYNAVLILLVLILVHFARVNWQKITFRVWEMRGMREIFRDWYKLVLGGLASVVAFFLGTPFALLDSKGFLVSDNSTGALWQLSRSGNRFELAVLGRLWEGLTTKIGGGFGYFALFVAIVGLISALRSRDRLQKVIAYFSIIFFLYVGSSAFSPTQIFMPLYIALTPLFVIGSGSIIRFLKREFFESALGLRIGYILILCLLVTPSLVSAIKIDYLYSKEDTRNIAKKYVDLAIPRGVVIGREGEEQPYYEGTHPTMGVPAWRYDPLSDNKIEYVVLTGVPNVTEIRKSENYGGILDNINPVFSVYNADDRTGPNVFIYKINYPLRNQWWLDESKLPKLDLTEATSTDHKWRDSLLPEKYTSTIEITGDWDLSGQVNAVMKKNNDYAYPVDKVGGFLKRADIVFANLSSPFTKQCEVLSFCASDNATKIFTVNPNTVVTTPEKNGVWEESKQILAEAKVSVVSPDDIYLATVNNIKMAWITLNPSLAQFNKDDLAAKIKQAREENSQVVIANFRWDSLKPIKADTYAAIDAGADVVIGNSQEVLPLEFYKNKPIFYGLGRFVSGKVNFPYDIYKASSYGNAVRLFYFNDLLVDIEITPMVSGWIDKFGLSTSQVQGVSDTLQLHDAMNKVRELY